MTAVLAVALGLALLGVAVTRAVLWAERRRPVWIVQQGVYHEREVVAVYRSLSRAKREGTADGWVKRDSGTYENDSGGELNLLRLEKWWPE